MVDRNRCVPKNRLGIVGWLYAGRFGVDRYAYILHRVTGLGILLYFILHIFASSVRLQGQAAWETTMRLLGKPIFAIGEYLVVIAFAYHAMNGIRLILVELGLTLGRPGRPVYPYGTSVQRQRPLLVVCMLVAAIFVVAGTYEMFFGAH
jgi:succinate dehydrogenase / fumarate reductase cytochrome b subunit